MSLGSASPTVVQQLQGNVLQPMLQEQAVDVPPALLLFAVLAAGMLFGGLGVLMAAPLTIVVFVMIKRIYAKSIFGKDVKWTANDRTGSETEGLRVTPQTRHPPARGHRHVRRCPQGLHDDGP